MRDRGHRFVLPDGWVVRQVGKGLHWPKYMDILPFEVRMPCRGGARGVEVSKSDRNPGCSAPKAVLLFRIPVLSGIKGGTKRTLI